MNDEEACPFGRVAVGIEGECVAQELNELLEDIHEERHGMELGVVTVDEFVHILTIGDVGEVYLVDDGGCVIRLEVVCLDGWREDIAGFRVEFVSCILSGGRCGCWDGAKVEGADACLVASKVVEFGIACEDLDFDGSR